MNTIIFFAMTLWLGSPSSISKEIPNGKQPVGKPQTLKFNVDLVFGATEDEDAYLWSGAKTSVSADGRGHMFVADQAGNRILEFDPNGKFVRTLGRKGQGPGEYQDLYGFEILANGAAVGMEIRGGAPLFIFYDQNLNYLAQKPVQDPSKMVLTMQVSPLGNYMGANFIAMDQGARTMTVTSGVFNDKFELVKTLTEDPRPMPDPSRFLEGDFWAEFIAANLKKFFKGTGMVAFDDKGRLYSALSNRYEITRWAPDLTTKEVVIKRDYSPIPLPQEDLDALLEGIQEQIPKNEAIAKVITPEVLKKALSLADPPPVKTPVFGIIPMEDGKFLVVHDVSLASGVNTADIYSAEGQFLGQASLKNHGFAAYFLGTFHPKMSFKNGFAYSLGTHEEGDKKITRFRYDLVPL